MFPSLWRRRLGFVSAVPSSPLRLNLRSDFRQACWQRCRFISLPCEKRFFSCMAFSVYEVIRVACLSRGWFVYNPCLFLTASNQTNYAQASHANDFVNAKSHARKKPLLVGYIQPANRYSCPIHREPEQCIS